MVTLFTAPVVNKTLCHPFLVYIVHNSISSSGQFSCCVCVHVYMYACLCAFACNVQFSKAATTAGHVYIHVYSYVCA